MPKGWNILDPAEYGRNEGGIGGNQSIKASIG